MLVVKSIVKREPRKRSTILESLVRVRLQYPKINITQLEVFLYVAENPGISIGELSAVCGTDFSNMSRIARQMTDASSGVGLTPFLGLIDFLTNPFDSRGRVLTLSEAGLELCKSLDGVIAAAVSIGSTSSDVKADIHAINASHADGRKVH